MHPVTDPVGLARAAHRQHSVEIVGHDHSRDSGLGKVDRSAEPWPRSGIPGGDPKGRIASSSISCIAALRSCCSAWISTTYPFDFTDAANPFYREWRVPAALINEHATVTLMTDDELWDMGVNIWRGYDDPNPPGTKPRQRIRTPPTPAAAAGLC